MKKLFVLLIVILFAGVKLKAQTKVANFEYGKPGTLKYEHFSFWVKDSKRAEITYMYGKSDKEQSANYLGKAIINGQACFKIGFANGYMLYVIPQKTQVTITDSTGKYLKSFTWAYEGPVNGIGTFCDVCADDEKDAIKLIGLYYMK